MKNFRFRRLTVAVLLPVVILLTPFAAAAQGLADTWNERRYYTGIAKEAASYAYGDPLRALRRHAFHVTLGVYLLGMFLALVAKDAILSTVAAVSDFYDRQVMYRLSAVLRAILLPIDVVISLIERNDIRYIYGWVAVEIEMIRADLTGRY